MGGLASCGIRTPSNTILCWGDDTQGQLDGTPSTSTHQSSPPGGGTFTQVSAGTTHTCGIRTNGTVLCWGDDTYGAIDGSPHASSPYNAVGSPPGGGRFSQISAGSRWFTCGVKLDGSGYCWGYDHYGQIDGMPQTTTSPFYHAGSPPTGSSFVMISASVEGYHACGILTNGTAFCWGDDNSGEVDGNPVLIPPYYASGSPYPGQAFVDISAGGLDTCGVEASGELLCWGDDNDGELDGVASSSNHVGTAPGGSDYTQVSASTDYTCGVKANGLDLCWGYDVDGQVNGSPESAVVVGTAWSTTALQMAAGSLHTCMLRTNGYVYCWGANGYGQVTGTPTTTIAQGYSPGAGSYAQNTISAGGKHVCGIGYTGVLTCNGDDADGQLDGTASSTTHSASPAGSYIQVSPGQYHTCALTAARTISCWGDVGSYTGTVATAAPAGTFIQVASGGAHSCGLRPNGTAVCWGDENRVEAGPFIEITAGATNSCGVLANYQLKCWGDNSFGQSPSGALATTASSGGKSTCTLNLDSTLSCFGDDAYGQSDPPIGQFHQVSAGALHACALGLDGTPLCWGDNASGEADAPPGTYENISAGGGLTAGDNHSCGVRTGTGAVLCWGNSAAFAPTPGTTGGSYTYLTVHGTHGWTTLTWRGVKRAIGFNVLSKGQTLNEHLITSRTHRYHFRIHAIVRHIKLSPVERVN